MKINFAKHAFRGLNSFFDCWVDLFKNIKNKNWGEAKYSLYQIKDKITYPFYRTYKQIKCIWSYLPILIADRDWDYCHFLYLIRHKLQRMEKTIRAGQHTRAIADANDIKAALFLLEQIINTTPENEAFDLHEKKWGKCEMNFVPIEDSENSTLKMEYPNVKTEEDKKEQRKHFRALLSQADKKHKQNYKRFFDLLAKKLEYWWN